MSDRIQKLGSHHVSVSAPQDIDIGAIESELKSMWHDGDEESAPAEVAVIRARVANLIVYLSSGEAPQDVDDILDEVTTAHPARALVISADAQAGEPRIDAWVAARCQLPGAAGKQVCCEQVTIEARGAFVNQIPSVVAQLLAPDLPVFLWARGTPHLADPLSVKLTEFSDRVILDSSMFENPAGDFLSLAALFRLSAEYTAITDLNWAAVTPRRTLMASFYDVAEYRPYLSRLDRVKIQYVPLSDGSSILPPRALLLAGWLAAALGWTTRKVRHRTVGESRVFELRASSGGISLVFMPVAHSGVAAGSLASTTLEASSAPSASFVVERTEDGNRLRSRAILDPVERAGRVLAADAVSEAELLKRELQILGHDRLYEDAVRFGADLQAASVQ